MEKKEMQPENLNKTILCRLCLNVIGYTNSEVIESVREVLEIVLTNLKLELRKEHRVCKSCLSKLFAAKTFKMMCMYTDDIIVRHVSTCKLSMIELKEVYLKMNGNIELTEINENQRICRLCLQLVTYGFVSLNEVDNDIIDMYIPQVKIDATKNPVICVSCFNSLQTYGGFLRNCLQALEKCKSADKEPCIKCEIKLEDDPDLQMIYKDIEKQCIKSEEIELKMEEVVQNNDTSSYKLGEKMMENKSKYVSEHIAEIKYEHGVKFETEDQINNEIVQKWKYSSEIQIYKCDICDYESKQMDEHKLHQLTHKASSKIKMYKCNICTFETKYKYCLKSHQLIHKDPSEIQMYKCDACDYETKYKSALKHHQILHKDPCEIQMYKCDFCTYETKHKRWLISHQLIHRDPSEIQMYKCDVCNFETKFKSKLKNHQLLHKDPTEIEMYKCEFCTYETKYRSNLKNHQLKHKDSSEIQMYKCNVCTYETKYKSSLKVHQPKHKDPSEIQMYKCNICTYETKYRRSLRNHQLIHKDPSEIQMYRCDACDFETKRKGQLIVHQSSHKKCSEIQMYKCEICTYETEQKQYLRNHELIHKNFSEIKMYRCDACNETNCSDKLESSQILHENPSEIQM